MAKISQRGTNPTPETNVPAGYVAGWSERHTRAEEVNRDINKMAFPTVGEEPGEIETYAGEDPAAIGFSTMGHDIPHMLNADQVRKKWEVPPLPASHHEGFGSSVAENIAEGTIGTKVPHIERHIGRLMEGKLTDQPLEDIVTSRRATIQKSLESGNPDADWYQGKAQALIHHAATQAGVPVPVARKTTAGVSPKLHWDITYKDTPSNRKIGRAGETVFPNIESATRIAEAAKGRTPDEAVVEVVNQGIQGAQRQPAARVAASMLAGELHGSERIPQAGESEKVQSFEVNLSDPTHPKYGYSPWVHKHQMSAHTADVQDARAGGFHEESMEVPREKRVDESGNPVWEMHTTGAKKGTPKTDKQGNRIQALVGKDFHESFLEHPAGADIAQSTALVARTEEFSAQRRSRGEEWAKQNARNFMAAPSQSMQWSVSRETGTVDVPEHIMSQYQFRPKGEGFTNYGRGGGGMRKKDWEQM